MYSYERNRKVETEGVKGNERQRQNTECISISQDRKSMFVERDIDIEDDEEKRK